MLGLLFALVALLFLGVTLYLATRLGPTPSTHLPFLAPTPLRPTATLPEPPTTTTTTTTTDSTTAVATAPVAADTVLVMAMHHSGTSLLTRVLMQMGLWAGTRDELKLQQIAADRFVDPAKFWERFDVIEANERLVNASLAGDAIELARQVRMGWITGWGFRASAVAPDAAASFAERMERALRVLRSGATQSDVAVVLKEPRLSLTWPFWRPLVDARRTVCVLLYRHPYFVATGLRRRPRNRAMQLDDWLALWEKYTDATLRACDGVRKVLVSHDALARSPETTVQELFDALRAFGVPGLQPVAADWLRAFLPPFPAAPPTAEHDQRLSERQRTLWRHLESGAAVRDSAEFRAAAIDAMSERELAPASTPAPFATLRAALSAVADAERNVVVIPSNTFFADLARSQVCSIRAAAPGVVPLTLGLDDRFCDAMSGLDARCFYDQSFGVGVADLARWTLDAASEYMTILLHKMAYVENAVNLGYNVLLADADIAWRGDALAALLAQWRAAPDVDLLIQSDARPNVPEKSNWLCAGFFYMRANERTSVFMRQTRELMLEFGAPDQDVWQLMLRGTGQNKRFPSAWKQMAKGGKAWLDAAELGLRYVELNSTQFANGGRFFAAAGEGARELRDAAVVVHANMKGYPKKIEAFHRLGLWHLDALDVDVCV